MHTIVVATDFGKASENAFHYALNLADQIGPLKLIVSNIYKDSRHGLLTEGQLSQFRAKEHQKHVDAVKRFSRLYPDTTATGIINQSHIETVASSGNPSDALIELMENREGDVLIIGAKRAPGLMKKLFGQVSQKLIYGCDKPVLVIPETWKQITWQQAALVAFDVHQANALSRQTREPLQNAYDHVGQYVIEKGSETTVTKSGDKTMIQYRSIPSLCEVLNELSVDMVCMFASVDTNHDHMNVIHKLYDQLGIPMQFISA